MKKERNDRRQQRERKEKKRERADNGVKRRRKKNDKEEERGEWRKENGGAYSFSILRPKPQLDEDTPYSRLEDITDLRKRFGSYMRQEPSSSTFEQELVFFYKINSPFETSF